MEKSTQGKKKSLNKKNELKQNGLQSNAKLNGLRLTKRSARLRQLRIFYVTTSTVVVLALAILFVLSLEKNSGLVKAKSFLSLVDNGKYNRAYAEWFSDSARESLSETDFFLNMQIDSALTGKILSRDPSDTHATVNFKKGLLIMNIGYYTQFDKDRSATESITMTKSIFGNNWRIDQYHIGSKTMIQY